MILIPKVFNLYNRLDRPTWQRWKDRRLRLLRFVNHPAFWGLPEDRQLLADGAGLHFMTGIAQGAAGSMKPAGGSTLALTNLVSSNFGGAPVQSGVRFLRSGDVQEYISNVWSTQNTATEWIAAAEETSTIGDDHQAKIDEALTSTMVFSPPWVENTYRAIDQTLTVTIVQFGGGGELTASGTAYVRETALTSNEVTANVFLSAEDFGGGILC